jgi:hypothetical protein
MGLVDLMFESLLDALDSELRTALNETVTGLIATTRVRLEDMVAEVDKERTKGLAEVAEERTNGLAEVDARRGDLSREIEAMRNHQVTQEGRVELNIGGYRFETSVQTLRGIPHTFFDAYFSGRYAQVVCHDGSIFVDRDGEHFGHILEYMRDGVVSVAELGARPSVSLLRALKREFSFYCIELIAEQTVHVSLHEIAYVLGGLDDDSGVLSMERYDASTGQWSAMAAMNVWRYSFGACVIEGEIYAIGGNGEDSSGVGKYSPSTDTWSAVAPMPYARSDHCAVSVGSAIYVLGGIDAGDDPICSVLKFDSTQGTWTHVAPMPIAICSFAACALNGDIYIFGGNSDIDEDGASSSDVFKFDSGSNEWSILTAMPRACRYHSVQVLDGLVYIVGGDDGSMTLRFDPETSEWRTLAPTLSSRQFGSSFVLNGFFYAAGGQRTSSSVERYDVASDTWTAVAALHESRAFFAAVIVTSKGPAEEQGLFDSLIAKAESERL